MGRMRIGRPSPALVVSMVALMVALGGGAYAAVGGGIPDSSGVFHGCVSKTTGALRVVTDASECERDRIIRRGHRRIRVVGEFAIAWNQTGQAGAQGLPGGLGAAGAAGATGSSGPTGATGSPGISDWQVALGYSADDSTTPKEADATCPAGLKAIAADGQIFDNPENSVALSAVMVNTDGSGARADAQEVVPTSANWSVNVEAICAKVG